MNMPDMPVNVPVDDPNADTEWNDILRKHGVIPEKPPSPTPMIEEAIQEARRLAHEHRLEGKDLDELAELEDDEDEDFLETYRKKRIAELSTISGASVYNQVYPLQKVDYSRDVTEESKKAFVVVLLTSTNVESRVLIELWRELAPRFGDIKFCQMEAGLCIEGYPDHHTPTLLIYKDGDVKETITRKGIKTLETLNKHQISAKDIEKILVDTGALKKNDARLQHQAGDDRESSKNGIKFPGAKDGKDLDDDDSDWE